MLERQIKHTYVTSIAIHNQGTEDVILDPLRCFLVMSDGERLPAAKPDTWLTANRRHQLRMQLVSNLGNAMVAGVASSRTATYTDNYGNVATLNYTDQGTLDAEMSRRNASNAELASRLGKQAEGVLRKSTVEVGVNVGGKVFFPLPKTGKGVYPVGISVGIAAETFEFMDGLIQPH